MIINTLQEFCVFLKKGKTIISIDYGQKKLGIAISSSDHHLPMPLKLITEESHKKQLLQIIEIIKNYRVCSIIVGLPINMNGTKSNQTNLVENFTDKLAIRTNLPIFMQDERLTSKAADNFLKDLGLKRKYRNSQDDLTAASLILETTLNSIRNLKR